ncbi:unnamed protein product [Linum trigynum]|uniref:Uncharacterized protein n=1 Tax=Linum trigynum TaxID=586398 RepID=A0AAV2CAR0_9ROSI
MHSQNLEQQRVTPISSMFPYLLPAQRIQFVLNLNIELAGFSPSPATPTPHTSPSPVPSPAASPSRSASRFASKSPSPNFTPHSPHHSSPPVELPRKSTWHSVFPRKFDDFYVSSMQVSGSPKPIPFDLLHLTPHQQHFALTIAAVVEPTSYAEVALDLDGMQQ